MARQNGRPWRKSPRVVDAADVRLHELHRVIDDQAAATHGIHAAFQGEVFERLHDPVVVEHHHANLVVQHHVAPLQNRRRAGRAQTLEAFVSRVERRVRVALDDVAAEARRGAFDLIRRDPAGPHVVPGETLLERHPERERTVARRRLDLRAGGNGVRLDDALQVLAKLVVLDGVEGLGRRHGDTRTVLADIARAHSLRPVDARLEDRNAERGRIDALELDADRRAASRDLVCLRSQSSKAWRAAAHDQFETTSHESGRLALDRCTKQRRPLVLRDRILSRRIHRLRRSPERVVVLVARRGPVHERSERVSKAVHGLYLVGTTSVPLLLDDAPRGVHGCQWELDVPRPRPPETWGEDVRADWPTTGVRAPRPRVEVVGFFFSGNVQRRDLLTERLQLSILPAGLLQLFLVYHLLNGRTREDLLPGAVQRVHEPRFLAFRGSQSSPRVFVS